MSSAGERGLQMHTEQNQCHELFATMSCTITNLGHGSVLGQ